MSYFEGTPFWMWCVAAGMSLAGILAWLAEHGAQFDLGGVTGYGGYSKE